MNPAKVRRDRVHVLTDLPNFGPAMARDLECIGISKPSQLAGQDPLRLYRKLCARTSARHDPCVWDAFISITRFMNGEAPRPWWTYTAERKR
jgi:hypothetical protein